MFLHYLIECHDTTGKVLAKDGDGSWVIFDDDYKHKYLTGPIKDSLEEGEWHGFINDSIKYTRTYRKGKVVPTSDTTGQVYLSVDHDPEFYGGKAALFNFLVKNIKYPAEARENHIQGKVYVSFVVEKDGSLTNVKPIGGVSDINLETEAMRVVKSSSPWQPGLNNGASARAQYTIPISFHLAN